MAQFENSLQELMQVAKDKGISIDTALSMLAAGSLDDIATRLDEIADRLGELVEAVRTDPEERQKIFDRSVADIAMKVRANLGIDLPSNIESPFPGSPAEERPQ